jgi:polyhydroxyalkanoate synthesis regulator phasin
VNPRGSGGIVVAKWEDLLNNLRSEGKDVPEPSALADMLKEARASGVAFLKDTAEDVERYLSLVAEGKLNGEDLKHLLRGVRAQIRAEIAVQKQEAQRKLRAFLEDVVTVLSKRLVKALV